MAVRPVLLRPPPSLAFSGFCSDAGAVVDEEAGGVDSPLEEGSGVSDGVITEVMTITVGVGGLVWPGVGVGVTNDVMTCVDCGRDEAVTTDVADGSAEDGGSDEGACEDSGGVDEGNVTGVELGASDVGGTEDEGTVRDDSGDGVEDGGSEDEGAAEDSVGIALDESKRLDVLAVPLVAMASTMDARRGEKRDQARGREVQVQVQCQAESRTAAE